MRHLRRKHFGPVAVQRCTETSLRSLARYIDEVVLQVLAPHRAERIAAILDAPVHDLADKRVYLLRIHPLTRLRGSDKLNDLWLHLGTECGVHHRSLRRRGVSGQAESRAAARGQSHRRGAVQTQRRGQSQRQEHDAEPANHCPPLNTKLHRQV